MPTSTPQNGLPVAQWLLGHSDHRAGHYHGRAGWCHCQRGVTDHSISRELNASPAESVWIVNAYQIAIIVSLLSLSFLGDMLGYRRVYQAGLALFIATSLFCTLSTSLNMLTFARVLQGFGGAALMSVNTALIRIIYPSATWVVGWRLTR